LEYKLFVILGGLVIAASGLVNYLNYRSATRDVDRRLWREQKDKLAALTQAAKEALASGNDLALVDYAKIVKPLNEFALWAEVLRETGEVVGHTDPAQIGKRVSIPPDYDEEKMIFLSQVQHQGRTIGWVRMAVDRDKLKAATADARRAALRRALRAFGLAAAIAVPLTLLVAHLVVVPLRRVLRITHDISAGHLEARVDLHRRDEFGELADQVNLMAEMLAQSRSGQQGASLKLAHDLKSPLAAIQSYLDVVSESEEHKEEVKKNIEAIKASAHRLSLMVSDILERQKLAEGKGEAALRPVNLEESLQRVYLMHKIEAEQKGLNFMEPGLPYGMPQVLANPDHLYRVLDNLVTNAIKYTEKGGSVWMEVEIKGAEVWVMVNDTGIGIASGEMPSLFQRFERGRSPEVQERKGVGLGLFIAKELVELMGGRIWAVSKGKNQGSSFVFTLKAAFEEVPAA